jgi:hypothetical protein
VTGLWPRQSAVHIPAGASYFPLLKMVQTGSGGGGTQPPIQSVPAVLPMLGRGEERPGWEADHKPPSSAEVTNEWSYTSIPPICHRGVRRINFTTLPLLKYAASTTDTADCEM